MSAELRRAAALMRERAEATHLTTDSGEVAEWHTPADLVGMFDEEGDAAHIASWHPAVAVAVADLLEQIAESDFQDFGALETCTSVGSDALAVARAYLRGSE